MSDRVHGPTQVTKDTGSAALDLDITANCRMQLLGFRIASSGASAAENLTIVRDAKAGSAYDYDLFKQAMSDVTDMDKVFGASDGCMIVEKGDVIKVDWANSNTKTYGFELFWRELY